MIHLISPLLSFCMLAVASTYMVTLITLRLTLLDASEQMIGFIHTSFYAGLLIGALYVERQIKQIGYIRAFAVFGALTAGSFLVLGLFDHHPQWIVIRFIQGYCLAGLYVSIEGWLLAYSTVDTRGKILACYMIFLYGSQSLSQFIIKYVEHLSIYPFIICALISILGIIPVLIVKHPAPEIHHAPPLKIMKYLKIAPLGIFGCFISGVVLSSLYAFGPSFAQQSNIDEASMMFALIFGGLLLQLPIGKASDRIDRRKVMLLVGLIALIPSIPMIFFNHIIVVMVCSLVFGGLAFSLYPLGVSQVIDQQADDSILPATAMALLSYGCGSVIGPVLTANLLAYAGYISFFPFLCFLFFLTSCSNYFSILLDKKIKIEDQSEFVAMPRLTTVANELDPRESPEEYEKHQEEYELNTQNCK